MFKSVEYAGFESHPELRATAERLTPVLANEIRTWRDEVRVRWRPHPNPATGVLDLTLELTLPNGVTESRRGTFSSEDFERPSWLENRCRRVWSDVLGGLIAQQDERVQASFLEPAEA